MVGQGVEMGLTMSERRAVVRQMTAGYAKAGKKRKGQLLDELIGLTGYNRWYAVRLLRGHGKSIRGAGPVRLVGDVGVKGQRGRKRIYDAAVVAALKAIWVIMDCICGKRLAAVLAEVIAVLERHHELELSAAVRAKLLAISPATIDRLLAPERRRLEWRGRSGTKPGTLLRQQIPIRTFTEWDEARPGFVQIDLVGHDGGHAEGDFCQTLDVTDVASGSTETQAVLNKAQVWVFEALQAIRGRLPFALLGIDSDNGSEFINHHLLRYAQQERISFTRGRAWKKNDGCFVEQKNYSVVRRAVGYARYQGSSAVRLLNALYGQLRLYSNFFQPVMKLVRKERTGAKVKKTYDRPCTPYQRLLDSNALRKSGKQQLRTQYAALNPAQLKRNICRLQARLLKLSSQPPVTQALAGRRRADGIMMIPTREISLYGNDVATPGKSGRSRASLRRRDGHFAQRPGGGSAARVSGCEKARTSQRLPTAPASARAGDRAASQSRARPAP
jgi:hypothetical protein